MATDHLRVKRERTAILRFGYSKPVALALSHGLIAGDLSFLDFGCGRGEDVKHLSSVGIQAEGWDPHFRPNTVLKTADVVNLGYVLNVIEDPAERLVTLVKAFELAERVLIVAVRVDHALEVGTEYSDGLLTRRGSFQKLFKQGEFRDYLQATLQRRPHMAALGVAYVFKDPDIESRYLAGLAQRRVADSRTSAIEQFSNSRLAQEYLKAARALGRPPLAEEFDEFPLLIEEFGSPTRIAKLTERLLSPHALQDTQLSRKQDILTYAAMMRLQGLKSVPFRSLPGELRADIKMIWPSYSAALHEAETFLFKIGKKEAVEECCRSCPVGKKLPDALYIHRSAEEQLGALLRLVVFAARQIVGETDYNVLKIATDGRSISFLRYDDFEADAHPALKYSVRVYLPRSEYSLRDYSESENPPILHRKDMLVDSLHPRFKDFRELSDQEEALGLLSRSDIGHLAAWQLLLNEQRISITGHRVVRAVS